MKRVPFSVFRRSIPRSNGKSKSAYYARFFDELGHIVRTKALGAKSKNEAYIEAQKILDTEGLGSVNPLILDFLAAFWKLDSPYVRMKALRGSPLSVSYVTLNASIIKKHLSPYLKGLRFNELSVNRFEKIILKLNEHGINPRTINCLIQAVRAPISDYCRKNRIPDPLQYLQKVKEYRKVRGTLTIEEINGIGDLAGIDIRIKTAILLGAFCGLRMGEVRGLQPADVDFEKNQIVVAHNYVNCEGLKRPKWGSSRTVPLPSILVGLLQECLQERPASKYILFNNTDDEVPISSNPLARGFQDALKRIGISDDERQKRNLVFHGLRHAYVSIVRASGFPDFIVMRLAGHKSTEMMELYSHIENVVDFGKVKSSLDQIIMMAR
jgi:integrase